MIADFIELVRDIYCAETSKAIPLHAPTFHDLEREYVLDCIESTFVSSVGQYVNQLEEAIASYTEGKGVVATVNGTSALHLSLYMSGVTQHDLVITQPISFVATCNAIRYLGADPVFVDVEPRNYGLCPIKLKDWLVAEADLDNRGTCFHRKTGRKIKAVVPMHTFGHPVAIEKIERICKSWNLTLIEDGAESLGSQYNGRHVGITSKYSCISFNGNKIVTCGGGGAVIVSCDSDRDLAKHISTTAKLSHPYEFDHDVLGFNYRMPNINAAIGLAQIQRIGDIISQKRAVAMIYKDFFLNSNCRFIDEPENATSNFWLNAIEFEEPADRDDFLEETNRKLVMTRAIWRPMHRLPMYSGCLSGDLLTSERIAKRVVNLPSSPAK